MNLRSQFEFNQSAGQLQVRVGQDLPLLASRVVCLYDVWQWLWVGPFGLRFRQQQMTRAKLIVFSIIGIGEVFRRAVGNLEETPSTRIPYRTLVRPAHLVDRFRSLLGVHRTRCCRNSTVAEEPLGCDAELEGNGLDVRASWGLLGGA